MDDINVKTDYVEGNDADQSPWATDMPEEILLKILHDAVIDCGSVPLLCRTAQVCSYWRDISYHRDLWRNIDLSSGWIKKKVNGIKWLCESRLCEYTKAINLEAWFKLTDDVLEVINTYCTGLTYLNLSNCDNLGENTLYILADGFQMLHSVELSNVAPIVYGSKPLRYFLQKKGPQLKKLVLSRNSLGKAFHKSIVDIYTYCPNLEYLDFCHNGMEQSLNVNVVALQKGCPKLKVLSLEGTSIYSNTQVIPNGFLDMEEFYVPNEAADREFVPMALQNSYKLKKLVYYISSATVDLNLIPAANLEHLKLPVTLRDIHVLQQIRWTHSLKVLYLIWMTEISRADMDAALLQLFTKEPGFDNLKELHLCGSHVSWHGINAAIEHCKNLRFLNCAYCNNIPKFWAREIKGELLQQLYKLINEGMPLEKLKAIQGITTESKQDNKK